MVRQSNNINTLAMMTVKQERDEPVRQFAARVRGLAAVCDLSVLSSCGQKVSEVDKWVRMSLISRRMTRRPSRPSCPRLTRCHWLTPSPLWKPGRLGKTSMKILAGTNSSSHVNRVQVNRDDQGSCNYCGKKGQGKNPNSDLRKTDSEINFKMLKTSYTMHFGQI